MPKNSGSDLLENALAAVAKGAAKTGAPWMVIGGIAIVARGVKRFTTDIDIAVAGDAIPIEALAIALADSEIVARIDDAVSFARQNLVLLLRHEPTGVDVDVSLAWSAFERDALASSTLTPFGRVRVPMASVEDLVVFKAIAGRPKDRDDLDSLLDLYPDIDLDRATRRVRELADLAGAPELASDFETIAARARSRSKPIARPKKPRPKASPGKKRPR